MSSQLGAGSKKGGAPNQDQPDGSEKQFRRTRFPKKPKKGGGDNESAASWTSPVGRRDDDPSLCSGHYACQAGCDEEENVLPNTWTSLQSHSFVKWCSSLPRKALNSRTPFGAFLLSTFHVTRSTAVAPAERLFPLPVPKVGIFEPLPLRCSSRRRKKAGLDQAFHVIVMALNFLHADCSFVGLPLLGVHPNRAQQVAFSNLRGRSNTRPSPWQCDTTSLRFAEEQGRSQSMPTRKAS